MPGQVHTKVTLPGTTGLPGYSPQWLHGSGVPSSLLGNNGDMYTDESSSLRDTYGPRASGLWGSVAFTIRGAVGPAGPQGIGYNPRGAWVSVASPAYDQGDMVTDSGTLWWSLAGSNNGHPPSSSPTWWTTFSGGCGTPQRFTATALQTVFTPTIPPSSNSIVSANRLGQYLGGSGVGDYTIIGVTVVFNAGLPVNTIVEIRS